MATASARSKPRGGKSIERAQVLCAELFGQLERDNALLRETLDNMTQGVLMFGPDRRIVVSNRRYLQMYGLSGEIVRPTGEVRWCAGTAIARCRAMSERAIGKSSKIFVAGHRGMVGSAIVRRLERFSDESLSSTLKRHEKHADMLMELD